MDLHSFLQSELDVRNALILLKGKTIDLPLDAVLTHWIEGGTLTVSQVPALYSAASVPELAPSPRPPLAVPRERRPVGRGGAEGRGTREPHR